MTYQEFRIEGMTCGHCVMNVRKELSNLQGVIIDDVQIGSARLHYDEAKVSQHEIARAIENAGYRLVN
ncbi:MAG: cation-transporting ATPase [Ignavibacteria bacterium]